MRRHTQKGFVRLPVEAARAFPRYAFHYARELMPLVANTPLSGTLAYWVIDSVAAELGEWLGANPDVHVGINVPAEILGRGGLEYAARRSGLNARAGQIVLEITERGVPDRLGPTARSLSAAGVQFAQGYLYSRPLRSRDLIDFHVVHRTPVVRKR